MPKKIITPKARKAQLKSKVKKAAPEERKITNKEIAYAYIIRHMSAIRPNNVVIAAIAGAKFRAGGNRLQRISDMIVENASKLMKRPKALLEKRGHEDAPHVHIDTSTMSDACDTTSRAASVSVSMKDDEEEEEEDVNEEDGDDQDADDDEVADDE